uniref:Ubiquitin carboxyl-terminal hydrolase n=1 Tax=Saccoglossus kowalevskii TaxID=10224 RepID=A0ABM0MGQ5_SACKO|nr:PREDICTED: ubiquitin carboxyl-terminal hydrolase 31-like [Saccoglossus kowalevskii]
MSVRQKLRSSSDGQIDVPDELRTRTSGCKVNQEDDYDVDDFKAATLPRHVRINREHSSTKVEVQGKEKRKARSRGPLKSMKKMMVKFVQTLMVGPTQRNQLSYPAHSAQQQHGPRPRPRPRPRPSSKSPNARERPPHDAVKSQNTGVTNDDHTHVVENGQTESQTSSTSQQSSPRINGRLLPGLCGVRNLGNTCFMNAVIQCLSNTDMMAEYFVMDSFQSDLRNKHIKRNSRKFGSKGEITEQFAILLKALWSSQYVPQLSRDFKAIVSKYGAQFKGSNQHDAQEFLMWLLDKIHEDLNCATKKKFKYRKSISSKSIEVLAAEAQANYMRYNNSFVYDLCQAQYRSTLTCPNCRRQRNTFEPYLCLSLPLPQKNHRLIKVVAVYGNQIPNMVQVGVSLEATDIVADLRQAIAKCCGIPVTQLVLTEVYIDGFQRSFRDDQPLTDIHDGDVIYAIETPHTPQVACVKQPTLGGPSNGPIDETVFLVLLNKDRAGVQGKRFGRPISFAASRNLNYMQLQKVVLKTMGVRQPDAALNKGPVFKLCVVNSEGSKSYISPDEGRPLCSELVERMMTISSDEGGPTHVKILLEWEVDIRDCLSDVILNDTILEGESVKKVKEALDEPINGSLADCFKLYTQEEQLSGDDAWHCPNCKKLQHGTMKKLGLWSLPDILIIHLKRFKQTTTRRTKLLNLIDFPISMIDMSPYLEKRNHSATPSTLNSLTSWSPWKRNRRRCSNPELENVYDLYAVCNHIGNNLGGGHYTAMCKNPINGDWYLFDDTKVTRITDTEIVTPSAYLLFYQRSNLYTCY